MQHFLRARSWQMYLRACDSGFSTSGCMTVPKKEHEVKFFLCILLRIRVSALPIVTRHAKKGERVASLPSIHAHLTVL